MYSKYFNLQSLRVCVCVFYFIILLLLLLFFNFFFKILKVIKTQNNGPSSYKFMLNNLELLLE
jgi:hypothetical protein